MGSLEKDLKFFKERRDQRRRLYNECVELFSLEGKDGHKLYDRIMELKWEKARARGDASKKVTEYQVIGSDSSSDSDEYSEDEDHIKDGPGSSSTSNPRVSPVFFSRKNPRTSPVTTPSSSTGLATIGNKRTVSPKKVEQGNVKKTTADKEKEQLGLKGKQTFKDVYEDYWGGGRKKRTRRRRKKKKKRTKKKRRKRKKRTRRRR